MWKGGVAWWQGAWPGALPLFPMRDNRIGGGVRGAGSMKKGRGLLFFGGGGGVTAYLMVIWGRSPPSAFSPIRISRMVWDQ